MKHLLFFILVTSSLMAHADIIFVIPVAYNPTDKTWSGLFGFSNESWEPFRAVFDQKQEDAVIAAERTLRQKTNGIYNICMVKAPYEIKKYGPQTVHFYFPHVKFIKGSELYKRAQTQEVKDFVWVPMDEFKLPTELFRPHLGQQYSLKKVEQVINQINFDQIRGRLDYTEEPGAVPAKPGQDNWGTGDNPLPDTIYFYDSNKPYYEFTNFYPSEIKLDNKTWPTTEHYFQAQKFLNPDLKEQIRKAATAREAFDIARANSNAKFDKWDQARVDVMYEAVYAKFTQHENLKQLLLNTANKTLVEDARKKDRFWGNGTIGQGGNYLGRVLMYVRDELQPSVPPIMVNLDDLAKLLRQLSNQLSEIQKKLTA